MLSKDAVVIALTETWLNSSVHNSEFNYDKFIFRKDRDQRLSGKKQGGGVLLAVNKKFIVEECNIFDADLDVLCVKLNINQRKSIYIVVVYFVPNCKLDVYRRFYSCIETNLVDFNCVILGDFNLRDLVLNVANEHICDFKSFLAFSNFFTNQLCA